MNIKDKMQEIHQKYGVSERANYEIQLFVEDLIKKDRAEQLILSAVVKCNCDERKQLEEGFEIHHLINDTYQVVGKDSDTVWKQGTLEDCNEWVML